MKKIILILMTFLTGVTYVSAGDIYVSTKGNDRSVGTQTEPVATIAQAFKVAREWRRTGDIRTKNGITIHVGPGTYIQDDPLYLRPEDSGTPESPTIVIADNGIAVISGGMMLNDIRAQKNGIYTACPKVAGRPVITRSLWINGKKALRASAFAEGEMQRIINFDKDNETITVPASSLRKYGINGIADAPQLEMVVHQRWAIAILRVKNIEFEGSTAVLSFHNPESKMEFSHPWPQPVIGGERGNSSFAFVNASQFVNEESEWWQDYATGEIRMRRPANFLNIVVPRLNRLMLVEGTPAESIHDITFRGIAFAYTAWERPMTQGHVTLQGGFPIIDAYKLTENEGMPWAPKLENQAWVSRPEAAVTVRWAQRINFENCSFAHLASTGLDYEIGCQDVIIRNNTFTDIGGTALLCGSFGEGALEAHRPYFVSPANAYTERFDIDGNKIYDATNEDWGAVGIGCGYVRDFNIHTNQLSRLNYSGICVGWGWTPSDTGMRNNRIEHNTVSDFARQLYDAGGIYTLSNQPNSFIRYNHITDLHDAPYATNHRAFYIYFDAETDGFTVTDNYMPKELLGYNNPGPKMVIRNNGPKVKKAP